MKPGPKPLPEAERLKRKRAARKRTYEKNKAKVLATSARYREAHKEEEKASRRAYYLRNRERVLEQVAQYRKENLALYAEAAAKRRTRKLQALPKWASLNAIQCFYDEAARLTEETGVPFEVDHVVSLQAKTVCGLHTEANLQIVERRRNRAKGNKWTIEQDEQAW